MYAIHPSFRYSSMLIKPQMWESILPHSWLHNAFSSTPANHLWSMETVSKEVAYFPLLQSSVLHTDKHWFKKPSFDIIFPSGILIISSYSYLMVLNHGPSAPFIWFRCLRWFLSRRAQQKVFHGYDFRKWNTAEKDLQVFVENNESHNHLGRLTSVIRETQTAIQQRKKIKSHYDHITSPIHNSFIPISSEKSPSS